MPSKSLNLAIGLFATTALAQSPLPISYRTILSNPDVLVMHVHYGAHEFVPMHDHPAVATLYVYLNDSGKVDIIHEGPNAVTVHRPPTHTGALRIAPGLAERHSIQSNSDTASDFLRIEFKHLTFPELPEVGRHIPATTTSGTDFADTALRVDRLICPTDKPCADFTTPQRTLVVAINAVTLDTHLLAAGSVSWLPASNSKAHTLSSGANVLLVTFLQPTSVQP